MMYINSQTLQLPNNPIFDDLSPASQTSTIIAVHATGTTALIPVITAATIYQFVVSSVHKK